jgi:phosphotriesterase-related protein
VEIVNIKELKGKVQTVLGLIKPEELGITLPHEHLLCDGTAWFVEPTDATTKAMAHHPVTPDILWWLRYHIYQNWDDFHLTDEEVTIDEVQHFKYAGGKSVVEQSNIGLGRDPLGLARISRATGLNVIMGSGYYAGISHGPDMDTKTEEEICEEIVRDIIEGAGNTGVCAGIIGEIGNSWSITKNELKSLRAAARAQAITGAALSIHPGDHESACIEAIKVLDAAGADLSRTVMDHIDRTVREPKRRLELAKTGCYLEYDIFGREGYFPPRRRVIDLPNDAQRINEMIQLIDAGYLNQLLISQDIFTKTQLRRYGGWGYAHILCNVLPIMQSKGVSEEIIHTIMVENPKRLLTFA